MRVGLQFRPKARARRRRGGQVKLKVRAKDPSSPMRSASTTSASTHFSWRIKQHYCDRVCRAMQGVSQSLLTSSVASWRSGKTCARLSSSFWRTKPHELNSLVALRIHFIVFATKRAIITFASWFIVCVRASFYLHPKYSLDIQLENISCQLPCL